MTKEQVPVSTRLIAVALVLTFVSCNNETQFLPEPLKFGQPEKQWRENINSLVNSKTISVTQVFGDTTYKYQLNLGDTTYAAEVRFNEDLIETGPLRLISYSFGTEKSNVEKKPTTGLEDYVDGSDAQLPEELCRKKTIDKIQSSLERQLGKPDSITLEERRGFWGTFKDTAFWYHSGSSISMKLLKGELRRPTPSFPSFYYNSPMLTLYQKDYGRDLSMLVAQAKKNLRPADVVSVYFDVYKESSLRHPENGSYYAAIQIVPRRPFANSPFETRAITAVGGSLSFTDRFGEELYVVQNYEFRPYKPIQYSKYNLVLEPQVSSYGDNYNLYLLPGRPEIAKLREAYMLGKEIKTEFAVKAISFNDGSIMK